MYRTATTAYAAALLIVGLTACGSDSGAGESASSTVTETSQTSTSEGGETETSSSTTTESSTTSSPEPTSSSSTATETDDDDGDDDGDDGDDDNGGGSATATKVVNVWVDDSWNVEEIDEDVCGGQAYQSQFSTQDDVFTCGATASSALACIDDDNGEATCIANGKDRRAIRFSHEPIDTSNVKDREGEAIPLYVELDDGTKCGVLSHDQAQHWQGKFSWYDCSDGSELLTDEHIDETFDNDDATWTVERSTDKGKPVETPVAEAVFAGK